MSASCPKCHRSATWSAKWQTCSACDFERSGVIAAAKSVQRDRTKAEGIWIADESGTQNSVVFHVKHDEVSFTRRTDGLCPRCGNEPKTSTGYCRACTNLRARERRMLTTTGRPSGRPRKLTNG